MSPKGLVALLLVGLCATQMASASYRRSREVEQVLEAAQDKLQTELATQEDAARSSMETVTGFLQKVEADVLKAASDKLESLGFPIDLRVLAELLKSNINSCVTNDAVKKQAEGVVGEMFSCVSKDVDSLKGLLKNMYGLWNTATNIPGGMVNIGTQCSSHGDTDVTTDALLEPVQDEPNHDLTPVVDEVIEEASKSRSKRWIWGLSRITRCIKSVYSLARNDLITIPGQMLSTASNAYGVIKAAANSGEIPKCVQAKAEGVLPTVKAVAVEVGTCLSTFDLDAIMAANPKLAGLKKMVDLSLKLAKMPTSALGSATAVLGGGASAVLGGANSILGGSAGSVLGRALGGAAPAADGAAAPAAGGLASYFG